MQKHTRHSRFGSSVPSVPSCSSSTPDQSELAAPPVRGSLDERFSPMSVGHAQAGRLYGGGQDSASGQDTRALLTFYRRVDFESAE